MFLTSLPVNCLSVFPDSLMALRSGSPVNPQRSFCWFTLVVSHSPKPQGFFQTSWGNMLSHHWFSSRLPQVCPEKINQFSESACSDWLCSRKFGFHTITFELQNKEVELFGDCSYSCHLSQYVQGQFILRSLSFFWDWIESDILYSFIYPGSIWISESYRHEGDTPSPLDLMAVMAGSRGFVHPLWAPQRQRGSRRIQQMEKTRICFGVLQNQESAGCFGTCLSNFSI